MTEPYKDKVAAIIVMVATVVIAVWLFLYANSEIF